MRYFLLLILLGGMIFTGCTYKIEQTHLLDPATNFNRVNTEDVKVQAVGAPEELTPPYMVTIYKPEIDPSVANVPHIQEYVDALSTKLFEEAYVRYRKSFILTQDGKSIDFYKSAGYRAYEIRSAITRIQIGSGWLRYFIGFGAGDVLIQWEGTVKEASKNETVASFVIGDRTNGDPNMAWNVKVFSNRYTVNKAITHMVQKFIANVQPYL